MNKGMCNCWIGILNSYDQSSENDLYLDTYIEVLKHKAALSFRLADTFTHFISFLPKDYIDRRRGLATLFNFCPWCGTKINWTLLRRGLKK